MRCSATLAPHTTSRRGRAARADVARAPDTGEERPREQAQRPGSGKADGDHDRRGPLPLRPGAGRRDAGNMVGRHQEVREVAGPGWATDPCVPARACCCPARPMVKVMMPPVPGRAHPVDLWLCGHHYRASLASLLAAGAIVEDLTLTDDQSQADRATAAA